MPLPCPRHTQKGQTIIEILIALAVGAIVLTAVASTATISVSNAEFAKKKTEAVRYVDEGIENVRIARDGADSWDAFLALTWDDEAIGSFRRETTVVDDPGDPGNTNRRLVTVTVFWSDAKGEHQASSTTILTSWTQ
jgi:prepilin-type N-terminal cleavage/methylation domain-containing protein